jgi:hypothetical protein
MKLMWLSTSLRASGDLSAQRSQFCCKNSRKAMRSFSDQS